ncbi:hypothetical protein PUN28_018310 [Cardiocondyla obscurior]|uniref:Uncharacterized protein n=1 Tax=Cardiocondyla obscurior TaxID=286306 RepID=A0AAW2EM57_9HYME
MCITYTLIQYRIFNSENVEQKKIYACKRYVQRYHCERENRCKVI